MSYSPCPPAPLRSLQYYSVPLSPCPPAPLRSAPCSTTLYSPYPPAPLRSLQYYSAVFPLLCTPPIPLPHSAPCSTTLSYSPYSVLPLSPCPTPLPAVLLCRIPPTLYSPYPPAPLRSLQYYSVVFPLLCTPPIPLPHSAPCSTTLSYSPYSVLPLSPCPTPLPAVLLCTPPIPLPHSAPCSTTLSYSPYSVLPLSPCPTPLPAVLLCRIPPTLYSPYPPAPLRSLQYYSAVFPLLCTPPIPLPHSAPCSTTLPYSQL